MNVADLAKIVGQVLRAAGIDRIEFAKQEGAAFVFRSKDGVEIRVLERDNGDFAVALQPPDGAVIEGAQQRSIRRALNDVAERWLSRT